MYIDTSELCDIYADQVDVVEPIFSSFGGVSNFYGKVTTVKCFENNGLIAEILEENGNGRVLVVDGGGAVRRALIDAELAQLAADNDWAGIIANLKEEGYFDDDKEKLHELATILEHLISSEVCLTINGAADKADDVEIEVEEEDKSNKDE